MTVEQIIMLTEKGWTKEDILALVNKETNPQPKEAPTPAPEPAPAPAPTENDAMAKMLETFNKGLEELKNTMHAINIQNDVHTVGQEETAQDFLAQILNP